MKSQQKPGRPRGASSERRAHILKNASKMFAELGFDKTTIRLIADKSGVDPKLVMHYFGNKQKLFMATVQVPAEVATAVSLLRLAPRTTWGKRISDVIWLAQKSGAFQTLTGVIRASASEPEAAEMFREFYLENLLVPIVSGLDVDNRELRALMLSSLMAGYVFNLEIVKVFDGIRTDEKRRKKLLGQLIQTILTSDI